jgi:hypothetical protein
LGAKTVQASVKDKIRFFRKCRILKTFLICLKGFESPWGYFERLASLKIEQWNRGGGEQVKKPSR